MKSLRTLLHLPNPALLSMILLLAACAPKATEIPMATATPDPCSPAYILPEVTRVNTLMREFDDAAQLASVAALNQMPTVIPPLQEIRREAQDLQVPSCLLNLKTFQLQNMNAVINTLMLFMQGQGKNPEVLVQGIYQARVLHEEYNQELAHLIGATYIPPALPPTITVTDTPTSPTSTTASAFITNPGPYQVNLRAQPNLNSESLALLDVGQSIPASGKTADGTWIQVKDQLGTTAWVYASLVQVTGLESLPIATP
jgi:hypothetical protein